MISTNRLDGMPLESDTLKLRRSLRIWAIILMLIGGIDVYGETLDFVWGVVLIIVVILAWKLKSPAIFIVLATLMSLAAFFNTFSILFSTGTEKLWAVLGLVEIACIVLIVREYRKYRHIRITNETTILKYLALSSAILSGINLFIPSCVGISMYIYFSVINPQSASIQSSILDQLITPGLNTVTDLSALALGLGLSVVITEKHNTSAAVLGVLMSAIEMAGLLCIILFGGIGVLTS